MWYPGMYGGMTYKQPENGIWGPILYDVLTILLILFNLLASGLTLYFEVLGEVFSIIITAMFLWGIVMHIFGLITVANRRQPDPCQVRFVKVSYVVQVVYAGIMFLILGFEYYMSSPRERKLLLIVFIVAGFGTALLLTVYCLYLYAVFLPQSLDYFYRPVKPELNIPADVVSHPYPYFMPN